MAKLADKLKKFKQLRTFNLDSNPGIQMKGEAYIKVIESLPASLEMFNN